MSTTGRKVTKQTIERIDNFFNAYANSSSGIIEPEGIERLCSDLEVDYNDIKILALAWKLNAEKQGYFTREEWHKGLISMRVSNLGKLKEALSELEKQVWEPSNFMDLYTYSFRYCLSEEKQKNVDVETICLLLELLLGPQFRPQVDALVEYLKVQKDYKVINMDQWMNFLRFCEEISFPDLQNYDPDMAWPLILDSFVDWMGERQRQ